MPSRARRSVRITSAKVLLKPSGVADGEAHRRVGLAHRRAGRGADRRARAAQDVGERRPRVLDVEVELPGAHRLVAEGGPAEVQAPIDAEAAVLEVRRPGARRGSTCSVKFFDPTDHGPARPRAAPRGRECGEERPRRAASDGGGAHRAALLSTRASRPSTTRARRAAGIGPGQDETRVHGGEAAEDVGAEAARADRGGDGGGAHGDDRGDAHAGQDHGQGEGQLHQPEPLRRPSCRGRWPLPRPRGRPAGCRCRCSAGSAGARRARGRHRGARADAAEEGDRDQEAEEGEARDRLREAGGGEEDAGEPRRARHRDPEGQADHDRDRDRGEHEHDVLAEEGEELGPALGQEVAGSSREGRGQEVAHEAGGG